MAKQGLYLTDKQRQIIIRLLAETDMSIAEIASRTRCSRSAIAALNRKAGVRLYQGRRNNWTLATSPDKDPEMAA
jgi:predicted DNA-binding protein YlxM (UPF0122 family)